MAFTLMTCKCCGQIFPIIEEIGTELCSECSENIKIEKEEHYWENLTLGHTCSNGRCTI